MAEARQIDRLVEQFDPDQRALLGQRQVVERRILIDRQMQVGMRGIGRQHILITR